MNKDNLDCNNYGRIRKKDTRILTLAGRIMRQSEFTTKAAIEYSGVHRSA
jgi:hypothetical protein